MAFGNEAPALGHEDAREQGPMAATLAFLDGWSDPGLDVTWDVEARTVTSWLTHAERPAMTPSVMRAHDALMGGLQRGSWAGCDWFRFYVMRARSAKVFSYGGDFAFLLRIVETKDAEALRKYGEVCIQAIHKLLSGLGDRTISIAAVAGTCLGGGLEGALACDYVVAERGKKLGLPEANIGMFPGAGGYAMLARKIGRRETERLITSGAYFTTDEAHEMGLVDRLCEPGEIETGIAALREEIAPRFNTHLTTIRARRRASPIELSELRGGIDDWVDAAMHMEPHHLMLMRHLLSVQEENAKKAAPKPDTVVAMKGEPPVQKPNPFRAEA